MTETTSGRRESIANWRFYFLIVDDTCRILKLIPHPK
jgi:hypothetical protein